MTGTRGRGTGTQERRDERRERRNGEREPYGLVQIVYWDRGTRTCVDMGGTSDPLSRCVIIGNGPGNDVISHRKSCDVLINQSNV